MDMASSVPDLELLDDDTNLVDYLNFDTNNLEAAGSFFQGDVDSLQPCSLTFEGDADIKLEDSQGLPSSWLEDVEAEDDEQGPLQGGKRRRRVRNTKQQELNRLAQQRYRQRKKEKYSELQTAVNSLREKIEELNLLQKETDSLRFAQSELQKQVATRDAALQQAHVQMKNQAQVMKAQQEKCQLQERQIADQQQTLEQQRQHLRTATLAGLDPQALSDRLLSVIKQAFSEVSAQQGPATGDALSSEVLVQQISRTLTSCCRELMSNPTKQSAAAEAPPAISVSCC